MNRQIRFWSLICLFWIISTIVDRLWWQSYAGLPAWDQAEYLNNALEHGRALGLLETGQWEGLKPLLDLSPKIPPLASLVNGSIMALAGDSPSQAAWSLSIWNGILLFSVAGWGLQLRGQGLALLSVVFVAVSPQILHLRSDYVLEMPLTATTTLALWRLSCWLHPKQGGQWIQAITAAICCTSAILVKQSALLILLPALLTTTSIVWQRARTTFYQLIAACLSSLFMILPWLRHNWITILGGTNRAVFESASLEGDPSLWTAENWIWYPRLIPEQIGLIMLMIGISGGILWLITLRKNLNLIKDKSEVRDDRFAWLWLIVNLTLSWLLTTASPNKDERYISPLLPPLLLLLTRGWWQWGLWVQTKFPKKSKPELFSALLVSVFITLPSAWNAQISRLTGKVKGPLEEIILNAEGASRNTQPKTMIVIPSTPDLNQHNVSYFGRRNGGQLIGRQLGNNAEDIRSVLAKAELVLLAEGNLGSVRPTAMLLDQAVRTSGYYQAIKFFPRKNGGSYSLWQRLAEAPRPIKFTKQFSKLANQLAEGPKGLEKVFNEIAREHMIDGHFQYQVEVRETAIRKLANNPNDIESRWMLALLSILTNRPSEASEQFGALEKLLPTNPWPSVYLSIISLIEWNPWKAAAIADRAQAIHNYPVLEGLGDLSAVLSGAFWRLPDASRSLPTAYAEINRELQKSIKIDPQE